MSKVKLRATQIFSLLQPETMEITQRLCIQDTCQLSALGNSRGWLLVTRSMKPTAGLGEKLVAQRQETIWGDFQSASGPAAVRRHRQHSSAAATFLFHAALKT